MPAGETSEVEVGGSEVVVDVASSLLRVTNLIADNSVGGRGGGGAQWANLGLQAVESNRHRYLLYFQMRVGVLRYHQ